MEKKYSSTIQNQINDILNYLDTWRELFSIKINYYQEGWAISLREKNLYPRYIVIFKPYELNFFSVKSFEIHFNCDNKETFKELYFNSSVYDLNELMCEIKEIIYGKDIANDLIRGFKK
ncbi:MAG: hypothetical protein ACFE8M_07035 [Candidatus Hermodarchaeota archaeon]